VAKEMSRRHKSRFIGMHRDLRWLGREIREAGGANAVWPSLHDMHARARAVIRLERLPDEPDADFIARAKLVMFSQDMPLE
jgi:hypothetical protein